MTAVLAAIIASCLRDTGRVAIGLRQILSLRWSSGRGLRQCCNQDRRQDKPSDFHLILLP